MAKDSRRNFLKSLSLISLLPITGLGKFGGLGIVDDQTVYESRIRWFKEKFLKEITEILQDTPFTVDLVTAVALHETGYLWGPLVEKGLSEEEILALCVGDTLDAPKRSKDAFPQNKSELLAAKDGEKIFQVAREALENIGKHNKAFGDVAAKYPDKFCHGFGIFQYDLQYYLVNPAFFLEKRWSDFSECLRLFVKDELVLAQGRAGYKDKKELTETELVYVAIAYNRGRVEIERGFKQGHSNSLTGIYYGEYIDEFIKLSKSIEIKEK